MKRIGLQVLACVLALVLFSSGSVYASKEKVQMTEKEYDVYYASVYDTYLCNKKSIGSEPGTEYYMTYTVEKSENVGKQAGLVGTSDPTMTYPYDKGMGMMFYKQHAEDDKTNELLKEGYTYFIKFTALRSGFRYVASYAKNNDSEYFVLDNKVMQADKEVKCGYFGIWIAGGITNAKLSHVRFYDKDGNDLGVQSPQKHIPVVTSGITQKATSVDHWYTLKASGIQNIAISNKIPLTTNKMYIEYTVKATESKTNQTGIAFSNQPEANYPHTKGLLRYEGDGEKYSGDYLLQEGAEYLITLERSEKGFTVLVQMTKDGKTTITSLPSVYGEHDPASRFFSLWFGEGSGCELDFTLENFKMYDENYQNLEVQTNREGVTIRHHGALTDYSDCEAVYYCKEDVSMYALFEDKSYVFTKGSEDKKGTYSINNNKITFAEGENTEEADYLFKQITKEDGKVYDRLYTYKVSFVTEGNEEIETQILSAKTGYYIAEPKAPTYKDYTFDAWCTWDGQEYDMKQVVTESTTLYARWKDGNGVTYLAQGNAGRLLDSPYVVVVVSVAVLALAAVGSGFIIKTGGKKNAKSKNE